MTSRAFQDSTGRNWEVFEVHRVSQKTGAVSAGLEQGWLLFLSGETKRRLAPIPESWLTLEPNDLERLCGTAYVAPTPKYPSERSFRPRIRRSRSEADGNGDTSAPRLETLPASMGVPNVSGDMQEDPGGIVERLVRNFALDARKRGMTAVSAMIELKALLLREHPDAGSVARDRRRVRRWFVEAFYFDRDRQKRER